MKAIVLIALALSGCIKYQRETVISVEVYHPIDVEATARDVSAFDGTTL